MVNVFLLLVLQGVFGAECPFDGRNKKEGYCDPPPAYSSAVWSPPRVAEHTVLVQYMSENMELHQVLWHTFGLTYKGVVSYEAVLERNLLAGNEDGVFLSLMSELIQILHIDTLSLRVCVANNLCVSWGASWKPLRVKHFKEMFRKNEGRMWQVNPIGYARFMCKKEVRLWFPGGGISGTPYAVQGKVFNIIKEGSLRYAQMAEELTRDFVRGVRTLAEAKLRDLEHAAVLDRDKVTIRYVGPSGVRWAVWDGSAVVDKNGKTLGTFLRDCVLQGTSLSYKGEGVTRHYAFVNNSLCGLLHTTLAAHLMKGEHVTRLDDKLFLRAEDLRAISSTLIFGWTVVPKDSLHYPDRKNTFSLTFSGVTLEGVCLVRCSEFYESLLPRNYLWALDHEALVKKKKKASWYSGIVGSDRMLWAF